MTVTGVPRRGEGRGFGEGRGHCKQTCLHASCVLEVCRSGGPERGGASVREPEMGQDAESPALVFPGPLVRPRHVCTPPTHQTTGEGPVVMAPPLRATPANSVAC